MTLDIDALLKATAQEVWDEEEPSDGHLDAVWLSLAVIVPAVTAEIRALHSPIIASQPICRECSRKIFRSVDLIPHPCPTVRVLDELDKSVQS